MIPMRTNGHTNCEVSIILTENRLESLNYLMTKGPSLFVDFLNFYTIYYYFLYIQKGSFVYRNIYITYGQKCK